MQRPIVSVVTAKGDLDWRETRNMVKAIDELAEQGQTKIVIEWSQAESINYLAIGLLLQRQHALVQENGVIKFARMDPIVSKIFSICGVDSLFESYATIEDALCSFDEEWVGYGTSH